MQGPAAYEELALRVRSDGLGGYVTQVVRSPYGCPDVQFDPEGLVSESASMLWASMSSSAFRRDIGTPNQGSGKPEKPQVVGDRLFRALFREELLQNFLLSVGRIEGRQDLGLRIRLIFSPSDPGTRRLLSLPWELLYRADTRDFIARNPLTPLVRYLEVPRLTSPVTLTSRLRILAVTANPCGTQPLALEEECAGIQAAIGGNPGIDIEFLPNPTIPRLRSAIQDSEFHALHFMGHGGFDSTTGEGFLVFADSRGLTSPVPGRVLGEVLKGGPSVRSVFLNACRTAQTTGAQSQDLFSGVAAALVLAGLPAVIAMQAPVSDSAAIGFSRRFYETLALGFPVDAAVAESRLAIYLGAPDSFEWAIPALFLSVPDGRIFVAATPDREEASSPQSMPPRDPSPASDQSTTGGQGSFNIGGSGHQISGGIHFNGGQKQ